MTKIVPTTGKSTASAKPTAKPDAKAKNPSKRSKFATVGSKDPAQYPFAGREVDGKLVATPEGFDHVKNAQLKKTDFAKPSLFYIYSAEALEGKAARIRAKADEIKKTGDAKGSGGKANRLVKMMKKANELRDLLASQGIDVEALLSATKAAAVPAAALPADATAPQA